MKITDNLKMREVNTISPKLSYYHTKVIRLNDRSVKKKKNFKVKLSSEVRTTVSPLKKKKLKKSTLGLGLYFQKKSTKTVAPITRSNSNGSLSKNLCLSLSLYTRKKQISRPSYKLN